MSLARIGNPLNIHGIREVKGSCPPHFTRFEFQRHVDHQVIRNWIYTNLSGRYWVLTGNLQNKVAFEDPGEATIFALSLNTFNKPMFW